LAGEFRRTKLTGMFLAFDADRNGYLDQHDFQGLADRIHRQPRVAGDPELAQRVSEVTLGWWDHLAAAADRGGNGQVGLDEVLAMVDRLPAMLDHVNATSDAVFDAVDENGDGRISRAEHRRLVDTWHGQEVDTGDVFELLDRDGDRRLGRSEFALLWAQFWISDNPADPGHLLCGPLPEPARRPVCELSRTAVEFCMSMDTLSPRAARAAPRRGGGSGWTRSPLRSPRSWIRHWRTG